MEKDDNGSIHDNPEFIVWHSVLMNMLQRNVPMPTALENAQKAVEGLKKDVNLSA